MRFRCKQMTEVICLMRGSDLPLATFGRVQAEIDVLRVELGQDLGGISQGLRFAQGIPLDKIATELAHER